MSTMFTRRVKCACCGEVNRLRVLGSTNAFGYSDLDFRPPEMKRSTMHLWVQECRKCGYVNSDIGELRENAESLVNSERYLDCDGIIICTRLATRFARFALLAEEAGDAPFDVLTGYHRAAWACDDEGEVDAAKELRCRAAKALEKIMETEDGDNFKLLLADLWRRSEQFDKVISTFEGHEGIDGKFQKAIEFEVEKAYERDWDRYAFGPEGTFVSLPVPRVIYDGVTEDMLKLLEEIRRELDITGEDNE